MRIIFLDIDGVLNTPYTTERICHFVGVDDELLSKFVTLIEKSNKIEDTKIVLSSTWRLEYKSSWIKEEVCKEMYEYLVKKLEAKGLSIFSSTKFIEIDKRKCFRYLEIESWLEEHKNLDISSWCVLDDEVLILTAINKEVPDLPGYEEACTKRLVNTDFEDGLTDEDIEKALDILNNKGEENKTYENRIN